MGRSAWANIPAIKNRRVIGIDKDIISRPCPRLTKGLVAVAGVLYPHRFEDIPGEYVLE
jgi:iron complex transport system substrate-binding protein